MKRFTKLPKRIGQKIFELYSERPIIFCAVVSFLLEFYIESFSRHSLMSGIFFLFGSPLTFICNTVIIFATMSISFPLKRGIAAWTTAFSVWFTFGTANAIVLFNRPSPFTASDFAILPSVLEIFTVYLEIWQIILICIGILAVIFGLVLLWIKCPKRKINLKREGITVGVSAVITAITIHASLVFGIVTTDYGNLLNAYYESGFPYSFSRSVFCRGISKPNTYGEESINEILDVLDSLDKPTVLPFKGEEKPDIIFVQLESFFDVSAIKGISLSENPTPTFTELKNNYPSGQLRVPLIGSGTANTEFEILTGMNIDYFSPGEYPFIAKLDESGFACESIATILKEYGYTSHAMHNNTGTFYNRDKVYPNLGFDSFTPIEYMYGVEYNPLGWAKDSVLIEEINKALASSEGSDFVFTVAVQPHGAYPTEQTGDYKIKVSGIPESEPEKHHMYSYYVNQIKETDDFIKSLTDYYSKIDKNTVIVFYGDHLPDLKLTQDDLSKGDMYTTEYVIWSNYDLSPGYDTAPKSVEAYRLSNYLFSLFYIDGGIMNKVHDAYSNGDVEKYGEVMKMIEYDALYGEKYCYKGESPVSANTRFGNTEIVITSYNLENQTLKVYGNGFNKSSVIYINGRRVDTELSEEGYLIARKVKDFNELEVYQEASDGTKFSKAESQIIKTE